MCFLLSVVQLKCDMCATLLGRSAEVNVSPVNCCSHGMFTLILADKITRHVICPRAVRHHHTMHTTVGTPSTTIWCATCSSLYHRPNGALKNRACRSVRIRTTGSTTEVSPLLPHSPFIADTQFLHGNHAVAPKQPHRIAVQTILNAPPYQPYSCTIHSDHAAAQ